MPALSPSKGLPRDLLPRFFADFHQAAERTFRVEERHQRSTGARFRRIVDQAIVYMQEHLDQSLSLAELARAVAVSPRHLTRLFKRMTGQTPIDVLIDLRLDKARELLRASGNRVTDVCNEVGYTSLSYFVRLFKRRFGVTPGKYARSTRD